MTQASQQFAQTIFVFEEKQEKEVRESVWRMSDTEFLRAVEASGTFGGRTQWREANFTSPSYKTDFEDEDPVQDEEDNNSQGDKDVFPRGKT